MNSGAYALNPEIQVIAPWREWDLNSRSALMEFCQTHQIPVEGVRADDAEPPYSMDANLLHISYEGGELEDPDFSPNECMWLRTCSVEDAPDEPSEITLAFEKGDPVAVDSSAMSGAELLAKLNGLAGGAWHWSSGPGGKSLRRHEVPRLLRDPGRHCFVESAPCH